MSSVTIPGGVSPSRRAADSLLGELLLESGKLVEMDIVRVLALQTQQSIRFGEAARDLGLVSDDDIQRALSRQFDFPYVDAGQSKLSPALVAAHRPFTPQAEALRTLRSQIMLRWLNDKNKTIAVTAARSGGSRASVAANLAIVFAQLGERTLLIDGNLRSPAQRDLFASSVSEGLSSVLAGRSVFKHAIVPIEPFQRLSVLFSGAVTPNPQELLGRVSFDYLMETAPAGFDVVLIDTPPILESADAHMIAARAGGYIVVTERDATRLADVDRALQLLEPSKAAFLGAVVNG